MQLPLAQATSEPPPIPPPPPFDYSHWLSTDHAMQALLVGGGTLLIGLLLLFLLRGWLRRARLAWATMVGIFAIALFAAAVRWNAAGFRDSLDPIAWWVQRLFGIVIVIVALRYFDRLIVVSLLTRRRAAPPRFIHQIINIVLAVFIILIYASFAFGMDIDKFLAGSAVVSIVLGLALQESLGNFFSGLVLQGSPPFAIGDWVIIGEHKGRVTDMTWRAITIHTDDDNFILIPNGNVAKADVINFHYPSTSTARYIRVGLDYDLPPAEAIAALRAAAMESPGVLREPAPYIYLQEFADSAVVYAVKFWIQDPSHHDEIESTVRIHTWYRLREKGFNIPFPIRTVEHISHTQKARSLQTAARAHRLQAVQGVQILQPLSLQQKEALASEASEVFLTTGQTVFHQRDSGDSFYIIYKGSVDVVVTPEGTTEERHVATLKAGDFFGEMSALTGQPRSATIRATAPLACVLIEKRDLLPIFQADPALMEKISAIVARRNAEREAILQGPGSLPQAEMVVKQQQSVLRRMMGYFGLAA